MAKKSMKERELKRQKTVARFAAKRKELKATIANLNATDEEVWDAQQKLQKMPRDASAVRLQRRCRMTGRPHAVYRKFGLTQSHMPHDHWRIWKTAESLGLHD